MMNTELHQVDAHHQTKLTILHYESNCITYTHHSHSLAFSVTRPKNWMSYYQPTKSRTLLIWPKHCSNSVQVRAKGCTAQWLLSQTHKLPTVLIRSHSTQSRHANVRPIRPELRCNSKIPTHNWVWLTCDSVEDTRGQPTLPSKEIHTHSNSRAVHAGDTSRHVFLKRRNKRGDARNNAKVTVGSH